MDFFNSAIDVLQTLVIALGAGLGVWGVVNMLEGYGNDNPGAKSQGIKQLMAGGGVALIGITLIACAKDINDTIAANHNDNILDTDKIVSELVEKYGAERVAHVLAARIAHAEWDGRYSPKVKEWARSEMERFSDRFKDQAIDYMSLTALKL